MGGVGDDPGLRAGERHRRLALVDDRHAQQRRRDALARGEQHVHLAGRGLAGDVVGEALEVVGRLAHGGHDDHDVVAGAAGAHDVLGDGPDAIGVGDRRAPELLHDQGHDAPSYRRNRPILRRKSASIDSPAVPKATKRERQRQNRDTRRAAMQAEEKRRRRFKTIRLFVIIIGAAVALAFLVSLTRERRQRLVGRQAPITCTNKKPDSPADEPADHRADRR